MEANDVYGPMAWGDSLAKADLTAPLRAGRSLTYNPLGASLALGAAAAAAGYFGYKPVMRTLAGGLGAVSGIDSAEMEANINAKLEMDPADARRRMAVAAGILGLIAPLALNHDWSKPYYGVTEPYPEWSKPTNGGSK
jgi:hypothetical protein